MSPFGLAGRTLMLGGSRSVLAILLIAASLCVLDLFAGHVASARARMEQQAVIGERMGHLAIVRAAGRGKRAMFDPAETQRVIGLTEAVTGVALVVPQMSVSGIASTGSRSALFYGEGIANLRGTATPLVPGKLNPTVPNGIAVSSRQAKSLGLVRGSNVTLSAATLDARTVPHEAAVVDIYTSPPRADSSRHSLLMPLTMAQTLLDTEHTERVVVYLSDAARLEERRSFIAGKLRAAGIHAYVKTWREQSVAYANERSATDVAFDSIAGMVFAVIAATVAATISMNAFERRREVATLRALGMRSVAVFFMFVLEGLYMALAGVAISLVASGLIAWVVNRALSYRAGNAVNSMPMLVELDVNRMAMAVLTVLAVALLAALVPAFKAARGPIAPALA